jgi:nucleoside-diphosphate-sugar epimerase
MQLLVIGGSGRTGQIIITKALAQGHTVTALVRNPSSLEPRSNLTITQGTPQNLQDIITAIEASPQRPEAVLVSLSSPRVSGSPFAAHAPGAYPRLMADSVANVREAMARAGVRKIVVMSSLGVGSSIDSMAFPLRMLFQHSNMRMGLDDHGMVDRETREAKGLDYVLVRPGMLTDGVAAEVKIFPDCGKGVGFLPSISRESVAEFMVEAVKSDEFVGRSPVITN